ncbi:hypothetical protein K32_03680 [Kaistia sp. 32K]|uniref:hypothetical protein n=1 Tax=Kaistia sp. 32K TaxID=2795690 RepID=UPI0019167A33|nr:hypothetical protein [Kaistia sp. 32K]BCP51751.1 hypothetical protein K32_03680 [Kaistia sp. 32K]
MTSDQLHQPKTPRSVKRPSRRQPIPFIDEFGAEALKIPLDGHGLRHAIVSPRDYQGVLDSGLTGAWFTNGNGHGRRYVRTWAPGSPGTLALIARVILEAGPGEIIRYANGDSLDLRGSNLMIMRGRAKRRDSLLASTGGPTLAA